MSVFPITADNLPLWLAVVVFQLERGDCDCFLSYCEYVTFVPIEISRLIYNPQSSTYFSRIMTQKIGIKDVTSKIVCPVL